MNDRQYLLYCRRLLAGFARGLTERTDALDESDTLKQLAGAFQQLADDQESDLYSIGPVLVDRLFTTYPDFAPTLPRELLWFLGADCLHFMPDDEIALYQRLDELRVEAAARGELLDLRTARAKLLKLQ